MTDKRLTDFAATTTGTPASDILEVVKDPGGSPVNYKITWDDFTILAQPDVYTRVYRSDNQQFTDNTWEAVVFDTARENDYSFWEGVTNPTRLTVPTGYGGIYVVVFGLKWTADVAGARGARIYLNGGTTLNMTRRRPLSNANNFLMMVSTIYPLDDDDYIEGQGFQNTSAALNAQQDDRWSQELAMARIARMPT